MLGKFRAILAAGLMWAAMSPTPLVSMGVLLLACGPTANFVLPAPTFLSVAPDFVNTGVSGQSVTIGGTYLLGTTAVSFGGTPAVSFTINNINQITAVVPSSATPGPVTVSLTTPSGVASSGGNQQFSYLTPNSPANTVAPTVTSVQFPGGSTAGGQQAQILGTQFTGATAVKFGATNATSYVVNSRTSITAVAPAGSAGTVDITVTNSFGTSATSAADEFTYVSGGATYRFNSATGNDANACSTAAPCKTIARLIDNYVLGFNPCDTINLDGGLTYSDAPLTLQDYSGSTTCPITLQSTPGTGRATIAPAIGSGTAVGGWGGAQVGALVLSNISNIVVQHLNVVAPAGLNFASGALASNSSNVAFIDLDISGVGVPNPYNVTAALGAEGGGNVSFINNTVHDWWGNSQHTQDVSNGMQGTGGGPYYFLGNTIYNTGGGAGAGIEIQYTSNNLISNNIIYNVGANTNSCGASIGIELYGNNSATSYNTTSYNEVFNIGAVHQLGLCDMGGFDFDVQTTYNIAEYNYIHDNQGPCAETTQNGIGNIFRYNLCVNNNVPSPGSYIGNGGSGYPASSTVTLSVTCSTSPAVFTASTNAAGQVTALTGQSSIGADCFGTTPQVTACTSGGCSGTGATIIVYVYQNQIYLNATGNQAEIQQTQSGYSMIVYNNTIIGQTNQTGNLPEPIVGMYYGTMGAGLFANNIFVQSCYAGLNTNVPTLSGAKAVFWYIVNGANLPTSSLIDFNDYYTTCSSGSAWFNGPTNTLYTSLASWASFTGQESHSITSNPDLTSAVPAGICGGASGPQPCPNNAILTGSPAALTGGAALNFPGCYDYTGVTLDYYGNTIPTAAGKSHAMGAYDPVGSAVTVNPQSLSPALTAPSAGTLSGAVTMTATSAAGFFGVGFEVDGSPIAAWNTSTGQRNENGCASPYSITWSSYLIANGAHTVQAVAYDYAGNKITSGTTSVTVSNSSTVTWDAINLFNSGSISLSNGNLTASGSVNFEWSNVRSTTAHSTGKYYVEVTVTTIDSMNVGPKIGLMNESGFGFDFLGGNYGYSGIPGTSLAGNDPNNSVGFFPGGVVYLNGVQIQSGNPTWANGDVVGFEIDLNGQTMAVRKNGGAFTTPVSIAAIMTSPVFFAATFETNTQVATVNFTATPPSGYSNW